MLDVLNMVMRGLHIASMATLVGGVVFACRVLFPAANKLPPDGREAFVEAAAARFRPLAYGAVLGLVVSGVYNLFIQPGHSPRYHIVLGIKLLLAMHVFAAVLLAVQPKRENRARLITGTAVSGLLVVLLSAYLRRIF